jgi:hypothetical protein
MVDELAAGANKNNIQLVDAAKLYEYSTKDLHLLVSMSVFSVSHDVMGDDNKVKKMNGGNPTAMSCSATASIGASSIVSSNSTTITSVTSSVLDGSNSNTGGSNQKIKVSDIFDKSATSKVVDKDR